MNEQIKTLLIKQLTKVSLKVSNHIVGCDDTDGVGEVFTLLNDKKTRLEIYENVVRSIS